MTVKKVKLVGAEKAFAPGVEAILCSRVACEHLQTATNLFLLYMTFYSTGAGSP